MRANPTLFEPDLATSLNNLALCLGDAGDNTAALAASREAVEIRRRLAQTNPARFQPNLATSLYTLSLRLGHTGDNRAALYQAARRSKSIAGSHRLILRGSNRIWQ